MALAMLCEVFWGPARPLIEEYPHTFRNLDDWCADDFEGYVNVVTELLEETTTQLGSCNVLEENKSWFKVKSFLWVSWQRCIMRVFW